MATSASTYKDQTVYARFNGLFCVSDVDDIMEYKSTVAEVVSTKADSTTNL